MKRCTLHLTHLEPFKEWLNSQGSVPRHMVLTVDHINGTRPGLHELA